MTTDSGVSVTSAITDIVVGKTERKPSRPQALQMASGETIPIMKEKLAPVKQKRLCSECVGSEEKCNALREENSALKRKLDLTQII